MDPLISHAHPQERESRSILDKYAFAADYLSGIGLNPNDIIDSNLADQYSPTFGESETVCRSRRQADTDTTLLNLTLASSDLVQMPTPRRHHLLVRGLGSGHYWTRSLVPLTYSTTVPLISEHHHKRSPLTLTRAQRTFGCPQTAAIAMVINSMRPIVQLSARLIKISPLPMWGHFHSTLDGFLTFNLTSHLLFAPPSFLYALDNPDLDERLGMKREPAESRAKS